VPSADAPLVVPSEAAPPFQVEVLDESGKRWMLWFVRKDSQKANDQIPRRAETESPAFSSSPARVAKEKDTPPAEDLGTPHTYTLAAPIINRPADNGSAPDNPVEEAPAIQKEPAVPQEETSGGVLNGRLTPPPLQVPVGGMVKQRSEEHTSELQSRSDLVCRLLLEKKNSGGEAEGPANAARGSVGRAGAVDS